MRSALAALPVYNACPILLSFNEKERKDGVELKFCKGCQIASTNARGCLDRCPELDFEDGLFVSKNLSNEEEKFMAQEKLLSGCAAAAREQNLQKLRSSVPTHPSLSAIMMELAKWSPTVNWMLNLST